MVEQCFLNFLASGTRGKEYAKSTLGYRNVWPRPTWPSHGHCTPSSSQPCDAYWWKSYREMASTKETKEQEKYSEAEIKTKVKVPADHTLWPHPKSLLSLSVPQSSRKQVRPSLCPYSVLALLYSSLCPRQQPSRFRKWRGKEEKKLKFGF